MLFETTYTTMEDTLDCSHIPSKITADSDIVGPGVMAAYFITAVVTILTVISAYLFGCLDDSFMVELDYKVMTFARRQLRHLKRTRTNLSNTVHAESKAVEKARRAAVTQFILTLSDQQLVTGLAILIAGLSDPRHLTQYEFAVVVALAWFSSTTHLTTLVALRAYMNSHGIVRDARVVGMMVILILLCFALTWVPASMSSATVPTATLPIQCTFNLRLGFADGMGSTATLTMVLIILIFSYHIRIQDLNFNQTHP